MPSPAGHSGQAKTSHSAPSAVTVTEPIPLFHKVAAQPIPKGSPIRKFGQPIGSAACDIAPGQWVHTHNVSLDRDRAGYQFSTELLQFPVPPARTFQGFRRRNGSAGTRNYIAVISTVNCSATTSRYVAQELARTDLSRYPNIDGVIPIVHKAAAPSPGTAMITCCSIAHSRDSHDIPTLPPASSLDSAAKPLRPHTCRRLRDWSNSAVPSPAVVMTCP